MRRAAGLVAVLAVLAGGLIAWRCTPDTVPFTAQSLHPVLRLRFLDPQEAYPFAIPEARGTLYRTVRGDVSWTAPDGFGADSWRRGHLSVLVVAQRADLPSPQLWAVSPGTPRIAFGRVLDRLPGTGPLVFRAAYRNAATVSVSPGAARITFVAGFRVLEQDDWQRRVLADAPIQLSDLAVALAFVGPDGRQYWTRRLHG